MLPKTHIIVGAIFSLLIFFIFPQIGWLNAMAIFLASFLIDVDHYIYYVYKEKDHSLKRAYRWFVRNGINFYRLRKSQQKKYKRAIFIFHGIECWLIILLMVFVHNIFLFILAGIILHMILDYIDISFKNQPYYIKISQIYTHKKNKKAIEYV